MSTPARLAAALVRVTGDFAAAEDLVQDAVITALQRWPVEGIPARPDAWLFTVARNRGLDVLRRQNELPQRSWPNSNGRFSRSPTSGSG